MRRGNGTCVRVFSEDVKSESALGVGGCRVASADLPASCEDMGMPSESGRLSQRVIVKTKCKVSQAGDML